MPQSCTLCDLPTPDPPVTEGGVEGVFCCPGCLEVYRLLGDLEPAQARAVRARMNGEEAEAAVPAEAAETFLRIQGMHCTTCEAFLETVAQQAGGVYRAEASYASDMIKVSHDPARLSADRLPDLLSRSGYAAYPVTDEETPDTEHQNTVARLLIGGFFAMMVMVWYIIFLYPVYYGAEGLLDLSGSDGRYGIANIWALSTFVLGFVGWPILRGAAVSLRVMKPNMDLLVALAAVSAYLYSSGAFLMGQTDVYFDVTVVIIMVVSIGNYYEGRIKRRAANLLTNLTREQVDEARRLTDDGPESVALNALQSGDRVLVRAGERIPVDGTVVDGTAAVNEALLTGEALPVTRRPGDPVIGGATVTEHALTIRVGAEAQSTLDRLVRMMWTIQSARPGTQRLADQLAQIFVPGVLVLAIIATGWHWWSGTAFTPALLTGLTVLIVSCPCALGLATPLAIASGVREALKRHIVIRDISVFERARSVQTLAFDKTGTLSTGTMQLLEADEGVLSRAQAIEQFSSHPVARAITEAPGANGQDHAVSDFQSHPRGAEAVVDGTRVLVGHPDWLAAEGFVRSDDIHQRATDAQQQARVPVAVGWKGRVRGLIVVGDTLRPGWMQVLDRLKNDGYEIVVLTGDSEAAANHLRSAPAVDQVFAEVRPEAKSAILRRLRARGPVAMIGDGSNDAPALAEADLGIAFGPTALAADAADVVITDSKLERVPTVFSLAEAARRRTRQNLGWAFLYNLIAVPLAVAGALNPLFAALAMASSSLLVVVNSSRALAASKG